jgi:2'-5' RNA ligase
MANQQALPTLWLLPDQRTQRWADHTIAELADQYSSEKFQSHVTLLVLHDTSTASAIALARDLASDTAVVSAAVTAIDTSDRYFQCLSLRLDQSAALATLRKQAHRRGKQPAAPFSPHLSLMYHRADANLQSSIRKYVADQPIAALEHITLDRLAVVDVAAPVSQWRIAATFALTGDQ